MHWESHEEHRGGITPEMLDFSFKVKSDSRKTV
jgi:hypothetical protein